jgi:CHAT domain-containing protein
MVSARALRTIALFMFKCIQIVGFSQLQAQMSVTVEGHARLNPDEVMISYLLSDSLLSIRVTEHNQVSTEEIIIINEIGHILAKFKKMIRKAETDEFVGNGQKLYSILIRPVESRLSGKRRVIIVPDHNLSDLPFEALVSRQYSRKNHSDVTPHFFIEDFEVVYRRPEVESARVICKKPGTFYSDANASNYSLIGIIPQTGFSSPGFLPDVLKELDTIGNIFRNQGMPVCLVPGNPQIYNCLQITSDGSRIIHLASHYQPGLMDDERAGFLLRGSGYENIITIKSNSYVSLLELIDQNMEADLIVLNACKSGYIMLNSGIEKNILPQLLIHAGASNIISTLWNVPDPLAKQFMIAFYRVLLTGTTYSTAMREVKLMMIRNRKTYLPTVWAPYVLTESD